jgi:uncharacterized protein
MQLDLTRYRQPLDQFARTFQPGELTPEQDAYRVVGPVDVAFDIHRDRDKFRLVGHLRTALELTCSRCLEPFSFPLEAAFDLRYLPAAAMSTESERAIGDDDLETSYYQNDEIDLSGLVAEQILLALPMKPLCREECRGLCQECGANLNTGPCACQPSRLDPRLAGLRPLKLDS